MGPGQKPTQVTLTNVYYCPKMVYTLISVSSLDKIGCKLTIHNGICIIQGPNGQVVGHIPRIRNLYRISFSSPHLIHSANSADSIVTLSRLDAHRISGHVNYDDLEFMINTGMITGIRLEPTSKREFCEDCVKGKVTRRPFPKASTEESFQPVMGGKVTADVCGPSPVKSLGGHYYFAAFHDKAT